MIDASNELSDALSDVLSSTKNVLESEVDDGMFPAVTGQCKFSNYCFRATESDG